MRVYVKRGIAAVPVLVAVCVMAEAHAQDFTDDFTNSEKWDFSIGAGAMAGPKYEGSDENEIQAMPFLSIEWNDFLFFNPGDGLGVRAYQTEDFEVSASIGYDLGRKASDSSHLSGLGNVDGAATANLNFEYEVGPITPYLGLTKQMGGANGMLAEVGIETMVPLDMLFSSGAAPRGDEDGPSGPALMFGISTEWADENYMSDYFGVTAAQSTASGLAQHTAGSGFKTVGAEVGLMVPFGESWSFNVMAEYSVLLGDAADSPIVKEKGQLSGGTFIRYNF